jgi:hypothetical protein
MKKIISVTFISFLLILTFSCNNNPTNPVEDQPGRRDYTWTVDTIKPNIMLRMWGSSPTDVWVVGEPGDFSKTIYHFDGSKWSTDGIFRALTPISVFGFSQNDVYMGCGEGKIWHFDGSWKEVAVLTKDGHNHINFENLWGESVNDLYAFGSYFDTSGNANGSVIAHYSDNKWNMVNTNGLSGSVVHLYKDKSDNVYMQVIKIGGTTSLDSSYIYEYNGVNYSKIYGNIWTLGLQADISLINGELYFILGNYIDKRNDSKFQTVLKVDNSNFNGIIWGRNSKDMFLVMTDGLAHYNGTDIEYLFHYEIGTQIFGAALFDKDVFFLIIKSQPYITLIYHGKLQN